MSAVQPIQPQQPPQSQQTQQPQQQQQQQSQVAPAQPQTAQQQQQPNIIAALGNAFKTQTGDPLPGEHIAQLLIANMSQLGELAKQGKLTQQQIVQVRPPDQCA